MADTKQNNTVLSGLTDVQVEENRSRYGTNTLTPPKRVSMWKLYLDKYRDPIIQILLVAAAISLVLAFIEHQFVETIGIIAAIFLATTIGFWFERDAARKFDILTALNEEQPVKVRRNGRVVEIARHDIVVGDVVLVEVGDEIPADGHLVKAVDLQVDESSLTGELLTTKHVGEAAADDDKAAYPADVLLRSAMVMNGRGEMVVTAVGDATEIGRVAIETTEDTRVKTPLNKQLDQLAQLISKVGSGVAVAAFVIFLIHDIVVDPDGIWVSQPHYVLIVSKVLGYFMMAVTLIVMAVPEGLPMAVTLALALNMRRMLKSHNLVRKLHASETMGAVTVVCTDKTGTLTQNKMTLHDMQCLEGDEALLAEAIAVNSTAELDGSHGIGNPTEAALLLWAQGKGYDYKQLRADAMVVRQMPFSTELKYMETVVSRDGREICFVKGAPEIVMQRCELTAEQRREAEDMLAGYQNRAMRTLAFAIDNRLQAIAAIVDPVRTEVPTAVAQCQQAGIAVKIVTGDTQATAVQVAREIGILAPDEVLAADDRRHITGAQWAALTDEEALDRAADLLVMSRARPMDKQRLVEMLQRRGEVVAVTGDGTNDAPALHHAHIGLSLGSGTSVAKEASDITILDDSFASIVNAVMWGRSLYRNIQRFLFFQLVVNVAALLLVLAGSFLGTEMPLTVTQILWVNLIMDTFAAMALASLPPSREVLNEQPRQQTDFIINSDMARGILFCGLAFFALMFAYLVYCERGFLGSMGGSTGVDIHELSLFFTCFVMLQFWNLFNAKSLGSNHSAFRYFWRDRGLIIVLVSILVGQWVIVTFGGDMFRTMPLSWGEWTLVIAGTSPVLWIGELWRCIKRVRSNH